jgi:hypothetical protein
MPVHLHKKDITSSPSGSTQERPAPALPDQQTFRQYLRELAYMGTARGSFAVNVIVFATTRAPGTPHLLILKNGFILDFGE